MLVSYSDLAENNHQPMEALNQADQPGLVHDLKSKIQSLAGQHSDVLENLSPVVRERVEALREIQTHHDELEAKFFEERLALELKYQKLYQPLYSQEVAMKRMTATEIKEFMAEMKVLCKVHHANLVRIACIYNYCATCQSTYTSPKG